MPKRSDPVEALAKVLWEAQDKWRAQFYCEQGNMKWAGEARFIRDKFRALASAAIAHLSKPTPRKPGTIRQHVAAINRVGNAKPKRGAKREKV